MGYYSGNVYAMSESTRELKQKFLILLHSERRKELIMMVCYTFSKWSVPSSYFFYFEIQISHIYVRPVIPSFMLMFMPHLLTARYILRKPVQNFISQYEIFLFII